MEGKLRKNDPTNRGLETRVLLLSRYDRDGASSRLRFLQYLPELEHLGVRVTHRPLFSGEYLENKYAGRKRIVFSIAFSYFRRIRDLLKSGKFDVIWIQAELFPYIPPLAEQLLGLLNRPFVVDYDDAIFHKYDRSKSRLIRWIFSKKIPTVMRTAQSVVVGNQYLEDHAVKFGSCSVVQIPTVLDYERYSCRENARFSGGSPVIGWIGSPTTSSYLLKVAPALQKVCESENALVRVIGADKEIVAMLDKLMPIEAFDWREDTEAELVASFHVGIMPLSNSPWEQGKCGYKLLQYMASGVPVVASATKANVDILSPSSCGILMEYDASQLDWESAIKSILVRPDRGRPMGSAGITAVKNTYCIEAQVKTLCSVLRSAVGERSC